LLFISGCRTLRAVRELCGFVNIFRHIYGFHGRKRGNKQGSPRRPFQHKILRPDVAAVEIDVPVVAAEHQDHATSPVFACRALIAYNLCMPYTIRKVPNSLDVALRRRAREQGKSLNDVAIEALARGAGVSGERNRQRDLRDIAGTWRSDRAFDRALAQDTVDRELWP
jgi:hypothetical protein